MYLPYLFNTHIDYSKKHLNISGAESTVNSKKKQYGNIPFHSIILPLVL